MNLNFFNTNNLNDSVHHLFDKVLNFPINAKRIESINIEEYFQIYKREDYYFISYIESIYFSGLVNDECFDTNKKSISIFDTDNEQTDKDKDKYKTLLIFSIKLKSKGDKSYTRTVLADISRAINRFNNGTPTIIVFNYDNYISITGVERTEYKRKTGEKLGKVSMLKDINIEKPHTGHLKILDELKLKSDVRTFDALYKQWREVFDVQVLNKKFYQEIYRWYEWAVKNVKFPNDINDDYDDEKYNSENIIRLLTRIIFIWFLKEKNLVPDLLFKESELVKIIKDFNDKNSTNYYSAILQNLFFAALNQKINERKFASEGDFKKQKQHYGVKTLFRYADLFLIETESVLNMFEKVPFVNGGLFDCLDNDEPVKVLENGKVKQKVFYFDGFSRNPNKKAIVPNILFFNDEDTNNTKLKVTSNGEKGLINILNSYKFTVAENTPIEEEIALDPELLGRIFENLLASYNEESKTTARKATGSFYTPREIVNYMVDESLIAYLEKKLKDEIADRKSVV